MIIQSYFSTFIFLLRKACEVWMIKCKHKHRANYTENTIFDDVLLETTTFTRFDFFFYFSIFCKHQETKHISK